MADYIVKDTELTSVANAIRTAGGTNSLLSFPNGFVSAVNNISGGGSSDFSTAMVTIVNGVDMEFTFPNLYDDGELTASNAFFLPQSNPATATAILYKGACEVDLAKILDTVSISGDIEDMGDDLYLITGDCTITIS